ncbi:hypothetical protein ASF47_11250 [Nocardioides sp. Leaf285]|nr:hypothetical protein ASF47_11250 [Nocardioides sp. Leaf285]
MVTPFVAEATSRPAPSRPGVLVVADEGLVAETVASALRRRGFLTEHVVLGSAAEHGRPDVVLVVADVGSPRRLGALRTAVAGVGTPWVLVTTTERGPWWGAALEAGASEVVECTSSLREVDLALRLAAAGHRSVEPQTVAELVAAWSRVRRERTSVERRIAQLSPRELEVLDSLFAGTSVAEIAVAAGVSEATVRTQVRAVLRKLHVRSQLAAVALYAAVLEDS